MELLLPSLRAQALFLLAQFGREGLAEIFGRKNLTNLDLVPVEQRRALHPGDRVIQRRGVDEPEAGDEVAAQCERP